LGIQHAWISATRSQAYKLVAVRLRLPPETYDSEPPPVMRTWGSVYFFVLGWLALLIALFYAFTRYFA
jgi:hypothetical protein